MYEHPLARDERRNGWCLADIDQPLDGSYEACLCDDERYSLAVTIWTARTENRSVDVAVNGDCVTPEPVDGEAPPVPQPAVPANGLTIPASAPKRWSGCRWMTPPA